MRGERLGERDGTQLGTGTGEDGGRDQLRSQSSVTDNTKAQGQVVGRDASLKMRKEEGVKEMQWSDSEEQPWRTKKMLSTQLGLSAFVE